ncbi:MAG: hypothetical protein J0M13_07160 [Candidatus Accumulibacter sp.]|nr:hypothetical protein [Candidatus Accumulibacter necessarius]
MTSAVLPYNWASASPTASFVACLRDVILLDRADEAQHGDVNHEFADQLAHRQT